MRLQDKIETLNPSPAAYVLAKEDDRSYLYKGSCRNLVERMKSHIEGKVSKTKNRRPLELIYFEYCDDFTQARIRENFFKTGAGRNFIKQKLDQIP